MHAIGLYPKNKPKSWVIFVAAFIVAVASLFVWLVAESNSWKYVALISILLFGACLFVAAPAILIYSRGVMTGRYRTISAKPWRDQVW